MSRESALVKNTLILSVGKFLPKLFTLITLPIMTAELSKAEYGTFDLIETLVTLLLPAVTLQIQSAAFRFLIDCRNDKERSSAIITNIMAFTLFMSVITVLIFLLVSVNIDLATRLLVGLYFLADIEMCTVGMIVRGLSYNKYFSMASVELSFVNMIVTVITLKFFKWGINGVILGLLLGNIIGVVYMAHKSKLFSYISFNKLSKKQIKEMLAYSWPMVPNNMSNWVLNLSDRLIIISFIGIEANGVFAVASKIPKLFMIVQQVLVMAWQENAAIYANDKDVEKYYSKMFDKIYCLAVGAMGMLIAFSPILFKILVRGEYDEAFFQMPILFLGLLFCCLSAFQGGIYLAYKKTKSVGVTTMISAGVNVLVDLSLINFIGITAGSVSTLVAYMFLFVFRMFNVLKIQKLTYNYGKIIGLFAVLCVMSVLCYQRNMVLDIVNMVISLAFFALINKSVIVSFLKTAKKKLAHGK